MAAFGGSVTYGVGTQNPEMNGWLQRVMLWIKATFPHPGHQLLNFVSAWSGNTYSNALHEAVPAWGRTIR